MNGIKEVIERILDGGEGPLYDFFIESGQLDSSLEIPESGGYLSPAASSVSSVPSISPDLKSKRKGDPSSFNLSIFCVYQLISLLSILDIFLLLEFILNHIYESNGDMNYDQILNIADILILIQLILQR